MMTSSERLFLALLQAPNPKSTTEDHMFLNTFAAISV